MMTEQDASLSLFRAGWPVYLEHLQAAIAPLMPEQLDLKVAPNLRSIRQLAVHIITGRAWWLHWVMHEGPHELAPLADWNDPGQPAWTAPEIVDGLDRTWAVLADGLARWTPKDLAETFQHPRRSSEKRYSRRWIVWHIAEHDIHHGGELSFSLGIHGLPGMDL
jgi:uncharacterized damage-inducible protein DinB